MPEKSVKNGMNIATDQSTPLILFVNTSMPKSFSFASLILLLGLAVPLNQNLLASPADSAETGNPPLRSSVEQPDQNKFYDGDNPDFHRLQKANEALAGVRLDKKGFVDWMTILRNGTINPRADLEGKLPMEVLDLDVILKNTKEMPYVRFPHNSHTQWLACSNCHDKIFVPKAGANPIDMTKIFQGKYCGVCHDRVAFITFFSCERCHSVPHGNIKAWW